MFHGFLVRMPSFYALKFHGHENLRSLKPLKTFQIVSNFSKYSQAHLKNDAGGLMNVSAFHTLADFSPLFLPSCWSWKDHRISHGHHRVADIRSFDTSAALATFRSRNFVFIVHMALSLFHSQLRKMALTEELSFESYFLRKYVFCVKYRKNT